MRGKFYCRVATDKYCPWLLVKAERARAHDASMHNHAMRAQGNRTRERKERTNERERETTLIISSSIFFFENSYKSHPRKKGLPFANVRSCFIRLRATFVDAVACRRIIFSVVSNVA